MTEKKFWDEKISTASQPEISSIQLEGLKNTLKHAYKNNKYYKKVIDEAGLNPDELKDIRDIEKLPFTSKDNLRENYPFGLFCTPLSEVIREHSSSESTGNPTVVGYTREDLEVWADVLIRIMYDVGVRKEDIVQVSHGFGLFTGGFGFQYAAEKLGALVIPISAGNTERQLKIMADFKSTVLVCTPSYTLHILEVGAKMGMDLSKLSLKYGFLGAEPWTKSMRLEIETRINM